MPDTSTTSLKGQILIAMPGMEDSRFHKTVIYICEHTPSGSMGIVLNRRVKNMSFVDLLQQVRILDDEKSVLLPSVAQNIVVHRGGPVETGRGFVLHSPDYHLKGTTHRIDANVSMTETLEILKALASGNGPQRSFLALGYAGWTGGQLESEIQQNGWLHSTATAELVFGENLDTKYDAALAHLGVNPALLSTSSGHA